MFRHPGHRTNCKSIFSAGLPIFELNTDLSSLEQFNFEYRKVLNWIGFFHKIGFEYSIWKDASPTKNCPSIYIIIFLLKNQAYPSLSSQVTFLTHIIIFFSNTIYLPEKVKIKKKYFQCTSKISQQYFVFTVQAKSDSCLNFFLSSYGVWNCCSHSHIYVSPYAYCVQLCCFKIFYWFSFISQFLMCVLEEIAWKKCKCEWFIHFEHVQLFGGDFTLCGTHCS